VIETTKKVTENKNKREADWKTHFLFPGLIFPRTSDGCSMNKVFSRWL
jgi:hypothetical protein